MTHAYERHAQKLLRHQPEPKAFCQFRNGKLSVGTQSLHRTAAAQAMVGIADRYERIQKLGVDAAALRDIPPALEFYDELLRTATAGQLFEWMQAVLQAREGVAA